MEDVSIGTYAGLLKKLKMLPELHEQSTSHSEDQ